MFKEVTCCPAETLNEYIVYCVSVLPYVKSKLIFDICNPDSVRVTTIGVLVISTFNGGISGSGSGSG